MNNLESICTVFLLAYAMFLLLVMDNFVKIVNRLLTMVDTMAARLHETYMNWDERQKYEFPGFLSAFGLKQFAQQRLHKKIEDRELTKKISDANLFSIKHNSPNAFTYMEPRPFTGLGCNTCSTAKFQRTDATPVKFANLLNVNALMRSTSFLSRIFCHLMQMWRIKKFNFKEISTCVLEDKRLREAIEFATQRDLEFVDCETSEVFSATLARNWQRARAELDNMRSTMSDAILRLTTWLLYKLLPCFLSSITYQPGQIDLLRKAESSGLPMIYLPLHRSHLDYIILTYIVMNNDLRGPLVAAGDNLRIPVFGSALRSLGAFFIKRRIDPVAGQKDIIYRAVLHTYMMHALQEGNHMEFFMEGGRTRTGKPCMPKGGILSVIVDAFMDGTIDDALLVPVSMNYERIVDGNFIPEQLGQSKKMESFGAAMRAIWKVLNSNYGMMRVDFSEPFSLKELIKTFQCQNQMSPTVDMSFKNGFAKNGFTRSEHKPLVAKASNASLYGTDVVDEQQRKLIENIAKHVIYDCAKSSPIMSTNALAFLLLNKHRNGATIDELAKSLDDLRSQLHLRKQDVGFSGESKDVIAHALDVLGPSLVNVRDNFVQPQCNTFDVIELAYYSNAVVNYFALDSILATSLLALLPTDYDVAMSYKISQNALIKKATELCGIFRYEFITYKPCQKFESVILDKIDAFQMSGICKVDMPAYSSNEQWCQRVAQTLDDHVDKSDSSDEDSYEEQYAKHDVELTVELNEVTLRQLYHLQSIIQPFFEAYYATVISLKDLLNGQMTENELIQRIIKTMTERLDCGSSKFREAISTDSIRNCLKLLSHLNVVGNHTHNKTKMYYLMTQYYNEEALGPLESKIKIFCERDDLKLNNNK